MTKVLISILKFLTLMVLLVLAGGRLFFPKTTDQYVIDPVRNLPIIGQILGVTWDKTGEIGPALTNKTVQIADQVENSDLGIDEAISNAADSTNFSQSVTKALEQQVSKQVSQLKDLPKETVTKVENQIRQEMYKQICSGWKEASSSAQGE